MATAQFSNCLYTSIRDAWVPNTPRISSAVRLPQRDFARIGTTFATGSPLCKFGPEYFVCNHRGNFVVDSGLNWDLNNQVVQNVSYPRNAESKRSLVSIRCEQNAEGGKSLDVWLGRFAMVGFAAAISVEIATGKGLLENFGLMTPLPTVALAVTALVGVLTAIFIFQSASES